MPATGRRRLALAASVERTPGRGEGGTALTWGSYWTAPGPRAQTREREGKPPRGLSLLTLSAQRLFSRWGLDAHRVPERGTAARASAIQRRNDVAATGAAGKLRARMRTRDRTSRRQERHGPGAFLPWLEVGGSSLGGGQRRATAGHPFGLARGRGR